MAQVFFSKVMFIFGVCFLISSNFQANADEAAMSTVGTSISRFNPCSDSFILMEQESGGPPSKNNHWKGTFNLGKFKKLNETTIEMTLDSDAVITVKDEEAKVSAKGLSYTFTTTAYPSVLEYLYFEVNAPANKPFPNIVSVLLNGQRVCENPKSWHPET